MVGKRLLPNGTLGRDCLKVTKKDEGLGRLPLELFEVLEGSDVFLCGKRNIDILFYAFP
jgi:hypothetical protein